MSEPWATVIAALLGGLPLLIAVVALLWLGLRHRGHLVTPLGRVSRIGVAGVLELDLNTDAIKSAKPDVPLTDREASALDRRIARAAHLVAGSRILWVDDLPSNNRYERAYLRSAGVTVVNARTTDDALIEMDRFDYDFVVTDMRRPEGDMAGLDLITQMRAAGFDQLAVAYVGHADPLQGVPATLFGLTDRPDVLIHLFLDALERTNAP